MGQTFVVVFHIFELQIKAIVSHEILVEMERNALTLMKNDVHAGSLHCSRYLVKTKDIFGFRTIKLPSTIVNKRQVPQKLENNLAKSMISIIAQTNERTHTQTKTADCHVLVLSMLIRYRFD